MRLENYHEASKYTEEDVTKHNKEMQQISQTINHFKGNFAIIKLIEELKRANMVKSRKIPS